MSLTKKEKIQIGIIVVVLVLLAVKLPVMMKSLNRQGQRPPSASTFIATPPIQNTPTYTESSSDFIPTQTRSIREEQELLAKQPWGRDPFFAIQLEDVWPKRRDEPSGDLGDLMLMGISLQGNRPMAIINRTIVKVGDEAFGMQVYSIEQDRVIFTENDREFVLRFGGSSL